MKLGKKLSIIGLSLVALLVLGVILAVVFIDSIAKVAIEKGGTFATGTPMKVQEVSLGIFSGEFGVKGLTIDNPPGFKSPKFFTLDGVGVDVAMGSLPKETIEVPRFALDGITLSLERNDGKTNYGVILDSLNRLKGSGSKPAPAPEGGPGKKLVIRELELKNITVTIDMIGGPGAVGDLSRITIPIDSIKLQNVGQTGSGVAGSGVSISDLSSIVISAVMSAAAEKGGSVIPADMLGDMQGQLAKLGNVLNMEVVAGTAAKVQDLSKKVGEGAQKAVEGASGAIKGLFDRKK